MVTLWIFQHVEKEWQNTHKTVILMGDNNAMIEVPRKEEQMITKKFETTEEGTTNRYRFLFEKKKEEK